MLCTAISMSSFLLPRNDVEDGAWDNWWHYVALGLAEYLVTQVLPHACDTPAAWLLILANLCAAGTHCHAGGDDKDTHALEAAAAAACAWRVGHDAAGIQPLRGLFVPCVVHASHVRLPWLHHRPRTHVQVLPSVLAFASECSQAHAVGCGHLLADVGGHVYMGGAPTRICCFGGQWVVADPFRDAAPRHQVQLSVCCRLACIYLCTLALSPNVAASRRFVLNQVCAHVDDDIAPSLVFVVEYFNNLFIATLMADTTTASAVFIVGVDVVMNIMLLYVAWMLSVSMRVNGVIHG